MFCLKLIKSVKLKHQLVVFKKNKKKNKSKVVGNS